MSKEGLPIDKSYWVIPGRFRAGEYPASSNEIETRKRLCWLLDQGINFVLDLTEAGENGLLQYPEILQEEAKKKKRNVIYQRIPIQDFTTPSKQRIKEILNTIDAALNSDKHIYLHCHAGKGRTGLAVGCWLARHGETGEKALFRLQALRNAMPGGREQSPETAIQKRMVMEWKQGQ